MQVAEVDRLYLVVTRCHGVQILRPALATGLCSPGAVPYVCGSRVWWREARWGVLPSLLRPTRELLLRNSDWEEGCRNQNRREDRGQLALRQRWRDGILDFWQPGGMGEGTQAQPSASEPNANRDGCFSLTSELQSKLAPLRLRGAAFYPNQPERVQFQ